MVRRIVAVVLVAVALAACAEGAVPTDGVQDVVATVTTLSG
jgi:uncharacterized membrane protein YraQ (UPF0718 family)